MRHNLKLICIIGLFLVTPVTAFATVYNVGSGQAYTTIGAVPWYSLQPGDTVYIYPGTYHEKFNISGQGTASHPISVIGILDSNGNRPIIDGQNAVTSTNSHFKWQDASGSSAIQWSGVIFVSVNSGTLQPSYIVIENLEVRNGNQGNTFTAENGTTSNYGSFCAGIYVRSADHVLIQNCVLDNNGLGIYDWTGPDGGPGGTWDWWSGLTTNLTIRGNYLYNNGVSGDYLEHQTYTEGYATTIEYNHYGLQLPGALGSELKDRSAGTVIRYNLFDAPTKGWYLDLVDPQNGYPTLFNLGAYSQTFVYGNIFINNGNYTPNYFHWDQDSTLTGHGRADLSNGILLFYDNTVLTIANKSDMSSFQYFNTTWGGYDCPSYAEPGVIDIRNNIFAALPRTTGSAIPIQQWAYCTSLQNFNFGVNWVSPGWVTNTTSSVTGTSNIYTSSDNIPGFISTSSPTFNLQLTSGSEALNKGAALSSAVTSNYLSADETPIAQYLAPQSITVRSALTSLGAYEYASGVTGTIIVTAVSGSNGTLICSTPVIYDTAATCGAIPNSGYVTTSITGCGGSWLSGNTYITGVLTANCTVSATFSASSTTYTVTPSAGANGSISPLTPQTVNSGSTVQFTVTPNSGYIASMGGTCGGTLVGTTYTTNAITANCTVSATFSPSSTTYTVTPSAGANGSISPLTPQTVNSGSTVQFTVTPNSGYTASVSGTCGGYLSGTTYTTNAIIADCTVSVTFVLGTKVPSTPTGVGVN